MNRNMSVILMFLVINFKSENMYYNIDNVRAGFEIKLYQNNEN